MTNTAAFLKQSMDFLLDEQKKIDEVIKKSVAEIKRKYQRWVSESQSDQTAFMEVKRDIDDACRLFHSSSQYLKGNGVLQEIERRTKVEGIDFDALFQRIQVIEKAMAGYQKDNDEVKGKQAAIEKKIDTTAANASVEIEKLKAADTKLDKGLASLKATSEKDILEHTMKLKHMESVTKAYMQKQLERDAQQDKELAQLKDDLLTLSTSVINLNDAMAKKLDDVYADVRALANNDLQLQLKTQDLEQRANEMQDGYHALGNEIGAARSEIKENAKRNLAIGKNLEKLSTEVHANSAEIKTLESRNQRLKETAENLQREISVLRDAGHEEKLQSVEQKYSAMDEKIQNLSQAMGDYINGRSAIGFTASPNGMSKVNVAQDKVITKFTSVAFNAGNHYNPSTGLFTAPVSGLYFSSVTVCTLNEGRINVAVKHRPADSGRGGRRVQAVSRASSTAEDTSSTGTGVVHMEAGDHLYAVPVTVAGDAVLSCYSSFSCFLLS
ncbi:unnamed protein product [Lymnaea stagnalis]|uniref:C1q domain-containing protein n=1 Tax=Lymnaea stagnalis TaxID=6523 RepID=A0AAV2H413_LYMST